MSTPNPLTDEWVSLDLAKLPGAAVYKLLVGAIVPRPIAFVSTMNAAGAGNLAPFSFFNAVSSDPPALVFAVSRKSDGGKKDTLRNIEETGGFVVNTVSEWLAEKMNQTAAAYPHGIDEMQKVGLTPLPSTKVRPPRVKEAAIQMECELYKTMEVGEGLTPGSSTLVVGRIVAVHVNSSVYDEGKIRIDVLKPIARLAGASYGRLGETFDLPRPLLPPTE